MNYVYILKSNKNGRRYTGLTSKAPEDRLEDHLRKSSKWTSQNGPFELVYFKSFTDIADARRREKFFKTGQGRRLIDNKLKSSIPGSSVGRACGC